MKPLIVAELSGNHLGSLDRALEIVRCSAKAGADLFKVQTFTPEQMVLDHDYKVESGPWAGHRLIDLYRQTHTPREWHGPIFDLCISLGMEPFGSAFHNDDVDFLESLGVKRHKISSFEITDVNLIAHAAGKKKPLIISTGMASFQEVVDAVSTARYYGAKDITLLSCVSGYPAKPEEFSLGNIATFRYTLGCSVGLSDHSKYYSIPIIAASLGVEMIEVHVSLDYKGHDGKFSLMPEELESLVYDCKLAAKVINNKSFGSAQSEQENAEFRRGLYSARDMNAGHVLAEGDLTTARPNKGYGADNYFFVLGMTLKKDIQKNEPITANHL